MSLRGIVLLASAVASISAIFTGIAYGLHWGLLAFCAICVGAVAAFLAVEVLP